MLPPETERVWTFLKAQPALSGFVLIGGTALALQIKHRRSEDLDLAYLESRLPRSRLDALRRTAAESGFQFQTETDEIAAGEFLNAGLDLHDYQQNFLVNGKVKVSFFAPDEPLPKVLLKGTERGVRVASFAELLPPSDASATTS